MAADGSDPDRDGSAKPESQAAALPNALALNGESGMSTDEGL